MRGKPGKLHEMKSVAAAALAHYDLKNPEVSGYAFATNLMYRVTTAAGEPFILRLASPGWRTLEDLQSEAMWLNALRRDTSIAAPGVIPARSGECVLPVPVPGSDTILNATLMTWLPGRLLGHYLTPANLEKMGALFAELHQHGAGWAPPAGFTTRCFEHWLSRGEPNLIAGEGQAAANSLPAPACELLERMHQHVESVYAAIDRADLRVIHCDLWHDNIKVYRGVLQPFDFEDTVWGFRAHDIAMAMLDLLETTGEERYPQLLAAFQRGYEANMPWPSDRIEPLQIGRLLWKINWVARHAPQWLEKMVARHVPVFEHYQQTGQVTLPAEG